MVRTARSMFRLMMIASLIFVLGVAPALATSIPAWINSSDAAVYNADGESVSVSAGTSVTVTAKKGKWAQVEHNGNTGYVLTKYLTLKDGITGYVVKPTPAYKSASTSSAKSDQLALGTELKVVGANGKFYQVTNGKFYGYVPKNTVSKTKPSDAAIMASKVLLADWSTVNKHFSTGDYVELYDIQSGLVIRARRSGGTNHAELEPAAAEDTEKILKMSDGKFSWDSRPVILHVAGKYVAGAINTMPQGSPSIKGNNFPGVFCLHLPGSKTHETNSVNSNHQAAIKYAYKWAQSKF